MGLLDMAGEVIDTLGGPISSIAKRVLMDQVSPVPGCVVRADICLGLSSHTGIYVGGDTIIEITDVDGEAMVRSVTPSEFLNGGETRTGAYIYVAASERGDEMYALGCEDIARRARQALGSRGKYFTLCNNCHQFTRYCILGEDDEDSTPWTVDDIVEALKSKFGVEDVYWRCAEDYFQCYS